MIYAGSIFKRTTCPAGTLVARTSLIPSSAKRHSRTPTLPEWMLGARTQLDVSRAVSRNAILSDGSMAGFELAAGERMLVRDDDGVPGSITQWWADPRSADPGNDPRQPEDGRRQRPTTAVRIQPMGLADLLRGREFLSSLAARLELTFADEVDVSTQVGRSLHIFDWTGVTPRGQFELNSPYQWDATNLYTTGEITLLTVPEPSAALVMLVGAMAIVASCRLQQTMGRERKPNLTGH